jgi:hypothetical protein
MTPTEFVVWATKSSATPLIITIRQLGTSRISSFHAKHIYRDILWNVFVSSLPIFVFHDDTCHVYVTFLIHHLILA